MSYVPVQLLSFRGASVRATVGDGLELEPRDSACILVHLRTAEWLTSLHRVLGRCKVNIPSFKHSTLKPLIMLFISSLFLSISASSLRDRVATFSVGRDCLDLLHSELMVKVSNGRA